MLRYLNCYAFSGFWDSIVGKFSVDTAWIMTTVRQIARKSTFSRTAYFYRAVFCNMQLSLRRHFVWFSRESALCIISLLLVIFHFLLAYFLLSHCSQDMKLLIADGTGYPAGLYLHLFISVRHQSNAFYLYKICHLISDGLLSKFRLLYANYFGTALLFYLFTCWLQWNLKLGTHIIATGCIVPKIGLATNYSQNCTGQVQLCMYLSLIHISEPTRPY